MPVAFEDLMIMTRHVCCLALVLFVVLAVDVAAVAAEPEAKSLPDAAKEAFGYLNRVRANPAGFSKEIGVDLSEVKPKEALRWNETLAKVATAKALDMARRDYFGHVDPDGNGLNVKIDAAGYDLPDDWIEPKSRNMFESLHFHSGHPADAKDGLIAIRNLILDKDTDPPFHRNHLLGISEFWSNCEECGIGMARTGDKVYCAVVVAKHDF